MSWYIHLHGNDSVQSKYPSCYINKCKNAAKIRNFRGKQTICKYKCCCFCFSIIMVLLVFVCLQFNISRTMLFIHIFVITWPNDFRVVSCCFNFFKSKHEVQNEWNTPKKCGEKNYLFSTRSKEQQTHQHIFCKWRWTHTLPTANIQHVITQ